MHLYSIWEIFHNLKNWWNQLAWFGRNYFFTTLSFVFLSIQLTSSLPCVAQWRILDQGPCTEQYLLFPGLSPKDCHAHTTRFASCTWALMWRAQCRTRWPEWMIETLQQKPCFCPAPNSVGSHWDLGIATAARLPCAIHCYEMMTTQPEIKKFNKLRTQTKVYSWKLDQFPSGDKEHQDSNPSKKLGLEVSSFGE